MRIYIEKKRNGKEFWIKAVIVPVADVKGCITHFVASEEDITKQKQLVEKLQKKKH